MPQLNRRSLDSKHKITENPLSFDGYTTVPWVEDEPRGRGPKGTGNQGLRESERDRSPFSVVKLLKACTATKDLHKGSKLHEYVRKHNCLGKNIYVANTLVSMYAKCGALAKAYKVVKELPICDVVSWTALIAGHVQQGQGDAALKCFDDMLHEGHSPNAVTFICALKACGKIGAAAKGEEIHEKIVNMGMLEKHVVLGNTLVAMYAKCGALDKAHTAFKELPMHDVVSWTALIAGHAHQGQGEEALKCFDDMLYKGHSPNAVTFICALKACASIGAAAKGEEIHDRIVRLGILEKDIMLGSTLMDMYAKCGALAKAHEVFKELPMHDVVTWNALIAGHAQQGQGEKALKLFDSMLCEGHSPNAVTFICALQACANVKAAAKGEEIHDQIVNLGMLEKDIVLGNTLVDMYVKCGALTKAYQVLKELPLHDVVSWNALIAGYAQQEQGHEVLKCFDDVLCERLCPDAITFACVLKACGSIGAVVKGEEIHQKIVILGMLEESIILGTTLVDMYAKCGALAKAHQVLKELPMHDSVSWNVLIAGYAQQGQGEEALKCFNNMLHEGHSPDAVTYTWELKACGSIGGVAKGKEFHDSIVGLSMLEKDVVLGITLVDMYIKCGAVANAQQVLEKLPIHNAVSWNTLIAGYAKKGQCVEAINWFEWMRSNGVKPNSITLTIVLNACSHSGLLDWAETYYLGMSTEHGIHPSFEHYCCLIDAFARAGKFNKALSAIEEMPNDTCLSSWVTLLGACHKWAEVKIGALAFKHVLNLDKCNAAVCVLMADIYRAAGMQAEAHTVDVTRVANKAWKSLNVVNELI